MAQARGRKAQLLLDFETTFGQDPATRNGIKVPFNTCGIRATQNLIEDGTIRNTRNPAMPARGNVDVSGDVVVPVDQVAIGYWLKAIFGAPTTTGTAAPYTHKFVPGDTQPSLVLEKGFTDIAVYEKFNGCKVSRLSMSFGGDGELTATLGIMGAKQTVGTASYDSTPTEITLAKFNNFQASIKEGGTTIAIVTQVSIDLDCGLDGDQYTIGGGGIRGDIPEGLIQVSGTLTALFESNALLNKAVAGTESSLEIALTAGSNSLTIRVPELQFERTSPAVDGPRGVRIELPFRGYYENNTDNAAIVVTLVNAQATY